MGIRITRLRFRRSWIRDLFALSALALAQNGLADTAHRLEVCIEQSSEVFASKGKAVITHKDIDGYLQNRVPSRHYSAFLSDPDRIGTMVTNLILPRQATVAAIEAGIHGEPTMQARMLQAADALLSRTYAERYASERELTEDEYALMAREEFLKTRPKTVARFDFSQLLIPSVEDYEDRLALLNKTVEIGRELQNDPARFDQIESSDSHDAGEASGDEASDDSEPVTLFSTIEKAELANLTDPVAQAIASAEVGSLVGPVRSEYGWHFLRLEKKYDPEPKPFEEVRSDLIKKAKENHMELVTGRLMAEFDAKELKIAEGAVEALLDRYDATFDTRE